MKSIPRIGASALLFLAAACGDEGTNTLAEPLLETRPASAEECADGGVAVLTGFDDNGSGVLDPGEIGETEIICDPEVGGPGSDGDPGDDALVQVTEEPAGANCMFGGQRIDTGLDDDGDGSLDMAEIQSTSYVCNGAPGPDGLSFLVRTSTAVGEACEQGGVRIESGLDDDRDGVLDDAEVDGEIVVCSGVDGLDALVDVAPEPAGPNCSAGGQRVRRGLDRNRSGALEPSEVDETTYLCSPVATLVRTSTVPPGADCANGGLRIASGLDADADGQLAESEVNATRFLCTGADGATALVRTTTVAAGTPPCDDGGLRVESGLDADADGVLDSAEVTSTSFACDASPGADGRGASAVRVTPEPAGANCANGGTRIETGPDQNGDGALQTSEVTEVRFTCSGANAAALVDVVPIPAGPVCLNGGQRLREGFDTNGNGTLELSEVQSTTDICSVTAAVQIVITTVSLPRGFRSSSYSASIEALGGLGGNLSWSVGSGQLPPGLTLAPSGTPATTLSGTLTATGTFSFEILVSDGFGAATSRSYTIASAAPPCEPGRGGVVGETLTTLTAPSSFGSGTSGLEADTSTAGFLYVVDSGSSIERVRKDGSAEEDVDALLMGVSGSEVNTIHVLGQDIYLTSDSTSCNTGCIWRISRNGGSTFSVVDLGDFTAGGSTNDMLQGVAVDGDTLYAITNDTTAAQLWSIDLRAASFPTTATLAATLSTIDTCNGLGVDASYFYSACDDIGNGDEGLVRIDRQTLTPEPVASLNLSISSGSWGDVHVVDTDRDGTADVAYVQGDNNNSTSGDGATFYVCAPGGATLPAFSGSFGAGVADDESLAYDASLNVIWQIDESSTNFFRFD